MFTRGILVTSRQSRGQEVRLLVQILLCVSLLIALMLPSAGLAQSLSSWESDVAGFENQVLDAVHTLRRVRHDALAASEWSVPFRFSMSVLDADIVPAILSLMEDGFSILEAGQPVRRSALDAYVDSRNEREFATYNSVLATLEQIRAGYAILEAVLSGVSSREFDLMVGQFELWGMTKRLWQRK